jgi:hypothetical protein
VGLYRDSILGNFASRQYNHFIDRLVEIKTILSWMRFLDLINRLELLDRGLFSSAPYQAKDVYGHHRRRHLRGRRPHLREQGRARHCQGQLLSTCLIGTTVQEVYLTHPALRATCDRMLSDHVSMLTRDLAAAKKLYTPDASWEPASVGYFIQCVLQGGFIFAKAQQNPKVAAASLGHLQAYLATLLGQPQNRKRKDQRR